MNTMSNIMWIELMDNESPCIYRFVYTREQLRLRKSSAVFGQRVEIPGVLKKEAAEQGRATKTV